MKHTSDIRMLERWFQIEPRNGIRLYVCLEIVNDTFSSLRECNSMRRLLQHPSLRHCLRRYSPAGRGESESTWGSARTESQPKHPSAEVKGAAVGLADPAAADFEIEECCCLQLNRRDCVPRIDTVNREEGISGEGGNLASGGLHPPSECNCRTEGRVRHNK